MNADIPLLRVFVRLSYISERKNTEEAYAFAISSVKGRALGFHCMLKSGAHYRHVPLHALTTDPKAPAPDVSELAYWDCFSTRPVVHVFDYLRDHEAECYLPGGKKQSGVYLFTIDWLVDDLVHTGFVLQPDQNKCGHVLELESGNLCMLPTNKIAWRDGYFIGNSPNPKEMSYKTQTQVWQAESSKRDASRDSSYYYEEKP